MKPFILIFLGILIRVQAFNVNIQYGFDSSGAINRSISITCEDPESDFCLKECGMKSCLVNEPPCINCSGSNSEILNIIFSKISRFYQVAKSSYVNKKAFLELIKEQKVILLDSQSPFNFFTNIAENQSLDEFNKLCPFMATQAWVVLRLDSFGFPDQPIALICENKDLKQSVYVLEELPKTPHLKYNLN
ncbi:MAG: hypothetical protein ACK5V3_12255 [Bdellovibrionales bacterium]